MTRVAAVVLVVLSSPAFAVNNLTLLSSIPTLDEAGLGLLIALVAGAAGWAVRRRTHRSEEPR